MEVCPVPATKARDPIHCTFHTRTFMSKLSVFEVSIWVPSKTQSHRCYREPKSCLNKYCIYENMALKRKKRFHENAAAWFSSVNHYLKCPQCVSLFIDLMGNLGNSHWLFEECVCVLLLFWVTAPQWRPQTDTMANLTNHVNAWNWTLLLIYS